MNQDVTISASEVFVFRRLENGGQVSIKIDLYKAMEDPSERILIQPGDFIFLRYTPIEAVAAFFERYLLGPFVFGAAAAQFSQN